MKILVVEDNPIINENLCVAFRELTYAVDSAMTAEDAIWYAENNAYDVIILDWMLPDQDGTEVLQRMRSKGITTPVIMLTARDAVDDRIEGLTVGADDYMVKPFDLGELLARVSVQIRRRYEQTSNNIEIGDLKIDRDRRSVKRGSTEIELSAREYALLEYLALREGHIVTRSDIYDHIYAFDDESASNVVDVYIGYLRKKIEIGSAAKLIHTHRGQGYRLGLDGDQ
ncbi:MAG: response regulator transcription factor [Planctomycetes bacterium]|nr:response regulator transcription factor [Planctomycetota bacterium]